MSEWKKFFKMPPIGKHLVAYHPNSSGTKLAVLKMGFIFQDVNHLEYPRPMDENEVKEIDGYWLELPELPE